MLERELKYALPPREYRRLLVLAHAHGATQRKLANAYFDTPRLDLLRRGRRLRIRTEHGQAAELTLKIPRGSRPARRERASHEISLKPNASDAARFLTELGMVPLAGYVTGRWSWRDGSVSIALDRVRDLGTFCEVEANVPGVDLGAAARGLGLRTEWIEPRSYLELVLSPRSASPHRRGSR